MTVARAPGVVVCLANGNLNGRVTRLVADELASAHGLAVQLLSATHLQPLTRWPEERARPHRVPAEVVEADEAERRVADAALLLTPPYWDPWPRRLVRLAHRAGVPVVSVVADVGYGAAKLDPKDAVALPDRLCVADPVTRDLLLARGVPRRVLRETGSPYLDTLLAGAPLPPPPPRPPEGPLRIGILGNPDGLREAQADRHLRRPEGVLPALLRVLAGRSDVAFSVRLHPRQDPARVAEAFPAAPGVRVEGLDAGTTLGEFVAGQHLVVGSHSMGLMEARLLGRPAVSFQPPWGPDVVDGGLRREVFAAWDVPVARDDDGLAAMLRARLDATLAPLSMSDRLYRPGRALAAIAREVLDVLAARRRRHAAGRDTVDRDDSATSVGGTGAI